MVGVDRNEQGLKDLSGGIRREAGDATDPASAKGLIDRMAAEVGPAYRHGRQPGHVPPELLTHAVRAEAIANVIAFLAGDLAAPVSGAIVPAYGAWPSPFT